MIKTLAAIALAVTLPVGVALAEPQNIVPPTQQLQQEALQPGQEQRTTENSSYQAFKANVNPNVVVPTTGVYDQGDTFIGRHGFPLEGWQQINNPAS